MLAPDSPIVREFLRNSLVMHIASRSARAPFVTPIWFTPHGDTLWITTGSGTRLAKNVERHPEVVLLLWGERHRSRGEVLRVRARATCHAGLPPWPVLVRIALRFYLAPGALASELRNAGRWGLRARYYAEVKGGPGHIRLVVTGAELMRTGSST
ncbi:MAG TPA: pyridoxamine 5'-phosphate oxidase family protein [Candidatus Binatia bacterium]|nr:pyridoxamine 5'-phosphate oxidase family protein [Candidatus Binatia bacterium]